MLQVQTQNVIRFKNVLVLNYRQINTVLFENSFYLKIFLVIKKFSKVCEAENVLFQNFRAIDENGVIETCFIRKFLCIWVINLSQEKC